MFHLKPKPSPPAWTGWDTPGQAVEFLRDHQRPGIALVDETVDPLQEGDGFEIFIAAILVRRPFAVAAGIIEVDHGGNGVHAQPVDMELLEPVKRVHGEEIGDLAAAEIIDRGVPVRVEAAARIGVFIKRLAVEPGEAMFVGGKMRRNPVEDHAQPFAVGAIDESLEALGVAEPR